MVLVFIITFCIIVALGFGAAAAWSDFNRLIIPNIYAALVGAAFIPAFLTITFLAPEVSFFGSWKSHLIALVFMFLVSYSLFHFKMIGGGDAKLLSVFALWAGVKGLMPLLFIMAVMGGVLGGVTLVLNKWKPIKNPQKNSWIARSQTGAPLSEGSLYVHRVLSACPLLGGLSSFRVSFIGGFTLCRLVSSGVRC